jgi:uncharacterized coiled-coil DUF342 family protein
MLLVMISLGSSAAERLNEVSGGLRRERDALWAEAEALRGELDGVRREKEELGAKLSALRSEVQSTIQQVTQDR